MDITNRFKNTFARTKQGIEEAPKAIDQAIEDDTYLQQGLLRPTDAGSGIALGRFIQGINEDQSQNQTDDEKYARSMLDDNPYLSAEHKDQLSKMVTQLPPTVGMINTGISKSLLGRALELKEGETFQNAIAKAAAQDKLMLGHGAAIAEQEGKPVSNIIKNIKGNIIDTSSIQGNKITPYEVSPESFSDISNSRGLGSGGSGLVDFKNKELIVRKGDPLEQLGTYAHEQQHVNDYLNHLQGKNPNYDNNYTHYFELNDDKISKLHKLGIDPLTLVNDQGAIDPGLYSTTIQKLIKSGQPEKASMLDNVVKQQHFENPATRNLEAESILKQMYQMNPNLSDSEVNYMTKAYPELFKSLTKK